MPSALVLSSGGPIAPPLDEDLVAVGVEIVGHSDCSRIVQDVLRTSPDLVVCFEQAPNVAFFDGLSALAGSAARPVVVFTTDPDADNIALATSSFVHAYVVAGYSRNRLRSVVHLAQARFRQEQLLRQELAELRTRFDERKLVDRAKGILMGARQLREDDAFRALRNAAMASKQRIGQVSQIVIDSARYAEAMNRAGQLRMLSQRLVKLYALTCAGTAAAETKGLFADSVAQVDSNLSILDRSLSKATFGDLLGAVLSPWTRLQALLRPAAQAARLLDIDALAAEMLDHAERLTANLEVAAYATALRAINIAGRQRMLSQRLAKEALIGVLLDDAAQMARCAATTAELVQGLDYLSTLPLSNSDIARELDLTLLAWKAFQAALADCRSPSGREQIAETSESLLGHFDHLTDLLERAIQAFVGSL